MMAPSLTVATKCGPVVGYSDTYPLSNESTAKLDPARGGRPPVLKWLGVPYGQAGRWERPTPKSWTEPLECLEFGAKFPEPESLGGDLRLHLNIMASEGVTPDSQVAVLFWVYGGALNGGSSDSAMFDGTEWIRAQASRGKKFILVTASYRTNICGFFSGADVKAVDDLGLSGNYGAYDIIQALTWVQENIAAFGGDPNNVTLFGESAGAFLVSAMLVCGKRLFRRAIMQSGAAETLATFPLDQAYTAYPTILASHAPDAATSKDRIDQLRALPIDELIETHSVNYTFRGVALTIEDGPHAIWTENVIDRLERGEWDEWIEAVIIGTNEHEGSTAAVFLQADTTAGFSRLVSTTVNTRLYATPGAKLLGDQLFFTPVWRQARALARQPNKKSGRETRVYMYRFREVNDRLAKALPMNVGSAHALEIAFVFNVEVAWDEGSHESKTAAVMGSLWSEFAINGSPDPNWRPFTSEQPSWLAIETGGKTKNESLVDYQDTLVDFTGKNFAT
ncbi:BQ5605_C031g10923 [Microbotryum silenes-dioicae]|uniref:Carboxylic ester hydrolase n=1 Tax=Microbotryum silenes-dioicae TaxID=796604 RepID=A0A2X0MLB1_9BASI|nr:BQ5605_C031g10923 [Microbotryum silenes-dioicae]